MDFDAPRWTPARPRAAFAARLEEAGLPRFVPPSTTPSSTCSKVTWSHGVTLYMDLTREDIVEPIDAHGRAVILGLRPCCEECASSRSPRSAESPASSRGMGTVIPIDGWP